MFRAAWIAAMLLVHLRPLGRALTTILAIHRSARIVHELFGAEDDPGVEHDVEEVAGKAWGKLHRDITQAGWYRAVDPTPSSQSAGASKDAVPVTANS
jgi:hypothetical protein